MTLKKQSQIEIFEQREEKEKQELEAYSKNIHEFDDEILFPLKDMEVPMKIDFINDLEPDKWRKHLRSTFTLYKK